MGPKETQALLDHKEVLALRATLVQQDPLVPQVVQGQQDPLVQQDLLVQQDQQVPLAALVPLVNLEEQELLVTLDRRETPGLLDLLAQQDKQVPVDLRDLLVILVLRVSLATQAHVVQKASLVQLDREDQRDLLAILAPLVHKEILVRNEL